MLFRSSLIDFGALIDEGVTALDETSVLPIYAVSVAEMATATDSLLGRLLWEIINDSQSGTWTTISAQNGGTWSVIDNSDPTTWNVIKTSN